MAIKHIAARNFRMAGRGYKIGDELPVVHNVGVLIDRGDVRRVEVADAPVAVVTPVVKARSPVAATPVTVSTVTRRSRRGSNADGK